MMFAAQDRADDDSYRRRGEPVTTEPASSRKWLVLLGAVALMVAIHLLPEPAPLLRGGNSIALTASGKACLPISR
jgi:hypothetical protein